MAATPDTLYTTSNANAFCSQFTHPQTSPGTYCLTDNRDVYYYTERDNALGLEYDERVATNNTLRDKYDYYTDLTVTFESPPELTGTSETDIIYEEGTVDTQWAAFYFCNDRAVNFYECDQGYVRFGYNEIAVSDGLPCHETGHAVGLVHGPDSDPPQGNQTEKIYCMRNPVHDVTGLGPWHQENLNGQY